MNVLKVYQAVVMDGCENSPGYFECFCPSGFTLSHEDNKTCIGKRKKVIHKV